MKRPGEQVLCVTTERELRMTDPLPTEPPPGALLPPEVHGCTWPPDEDAKTTCGVPQAGLNKAPAHSRLITCPDCLHKRIVELEDQRKQALAYIVFLNTAGELGPHNTWRLQKCLGTVDANGGQ